VNAPAPAPPSSSGALAVSSRSLALRWLSAALALSPALAGSPAAAQLAASAAVQTDYRYRGRSLTERRPAAAINVSYDHASGLYAGATAVAADTARTGLKLLYDTQYLGYARRLSPGLAWDLGVTRSEFISYRNGRRNVENKEAYVGLALPNVSLRLHYAPDYVKSGTRTLYGDLNGSYRLRPDWRMFGHAGVLTQVGGPLRAGTPRSRWDLSAGTAVLFRSVEASLTWTHLHPYPVGRPAQQDVAVLGVTYFF